MSSFSHLTVLYPHDRPSRLVLVEHCFCVTVLYSLFPCVHSDFTVLVIHGACIRPQFYSSESIANHEQMTYKNYFHKL